MKAMFVKNLTNELLLILLFVMLHAHKDLEVVT